MKHTFLLSTLALTLFSLSCAQKQPESTELPIIDTADIQIEESYAVDNLDFFEEEKTAKEFMENVINLLIDILNTQHDTNKEALNAYITQQLTDLIAQNKVTVKISVSSQKRQTSQQSGYDEETKVVVSNFADMVSSFFNIVKDPNNSGNVAVNLTSMFSNVVNIALLATKAGKLNQESAELFANANLPTITLSL